MFSRLNIASLFFTACLWLQPDISAAQVKTPGERQLAGDNYSRAIPLLLAERSRDSTNGRTNYEVGLCYLHSRSQQVKAVRYLDYAFKLSPSIFTTRESGPREAPVDVLPRLAEAFEHAQEFGKAESCYRKYKAVLQTKKAPEEMINSVDHRIRLAHMAGEIRHDYYASIPAKMREALRNTDTLHSTYSAITNTQTGIAAHTLSFPVKVTRHSDQKFFYSTKIVASDTAKTAKKELKQNMKALRPDTIINVTTIGTSADGQILMTYRDENGDGNLYISKMRNNKWSVPEKLARPVNEKGWENNECMSASRNVLYFVSDRAGGYGGKDLYACIRKKDGEWGKAFNLGPDINTVYDEEAPFAHPDGRTLFFSSNRSKPEVSFDHFMAVRSDSTSWSKPGIVGYPVDQNKDQVFYQVTAAAKKNYVAKPLSKKELKKLVADSIKEAGSLRKNSYLLGIRNEGAIPAYVLAGELPGMPGLSAPDDYCAVDILITEQQTGKEIGRYSANDRGKFVIALPTGSNMSVTYSKNGFLFSSHNISTVRDTALVRYPAISLAPIKSKSSTNISAVLFSGQTSSLTTEGERQIQEMINLLKRQPGISIGLTNIIASPDGKAMKYLARQRAEAITDYMIANGIDRKRIETSWIAKTPVNKKKNQLPEGNHLQLTITGT